MTRLQNRCLENHHEPSVMAAYGWQNLQNLLLSCLGIAPFGTALRFIMPCIPVKKDTWPWKRKCLSLLHILPLLLTGREYLTLERISTIWMIALHQWLFPEMANIDELYFSPGSYCLIHFSVKPSLSELSRSNIKRNN